MSSRQNKRTLGLKGGGRWGGGRAGCSKTNKGEQGGRGGLKTYGRYIFKKIVFQDVSKQ